MNDARAKDSVAEADYLIILATEFALRETGVSKL